MTCVIANVNLLVPKPCVEIFLNTIKQDIMGALLNRINAFAGFRTFPDYVVRLQARKTQPFMRRELNLLARGFLLKYRATPEWVLNLLLEARGIKWFFNF